MISWSNHFLKEKLLGVFLLLFMKKKEFDNGRTKIKAVSQSLFNLFLNKMVFLPEFTTLLRFTL